jgi:hypothetical protein
MLVESMIDFTLAIMLAVMMSTKERVVGFS